MSAFILISTEAAYPTVVEFAPYQKNPKKTTRKVDPRTGTVEEGKCVFIFHKILFEIEYFEKKNKMAW